MRFPAVLILGKLKQCKLGCRLLSNLTFNQPEPNWGLHLTPLRGAGEAGR